MKIVMWDFYQQNNIQLIDFNLGLILLTRFM